MTTAQELITLSLKNAGIIGVGQTASAEDSNDALKILNFMIAQWRRKTWLVYHLVDVSKVSTGAVSYTVGTGGDFNVARPDKLEGAFLRQIVPSQPSAVDFPLSILTSRIDYNNIALKTLSTFPTHIFYDAAYPLGYLYPWPVPQGSVYEIHITLKEVLNSITSLSTTIALPEEYEAALFYNLSVRLRTGYQLPPDSALIALAKDALNTIRSANAQIPRVTMPPALIRPGVYNPYSDQVR